MLNAQVRKHKKRVACSISGLPHTVYRHGVHVISAFFVTHILFALLCALCEENIQRSDGYLPLVMPHIHSTLDTFCCFSEYESIYKQLCFYLWKFLCSGFLVLPIFTSLLCPETIILLLALKHTSFLLEISRHLLFFVVCAVDRERERGIFGGGRKRCRGGTEYIFLF